MNVRSDAASDGAWLSTMAEQLAQSRRCAASSVASPAAGNSPRRKRCTSSSVTCDPMAEDGGKVALWLPPPFPLRHSPPQPCARGLAQIDDLLAGQTEHRSD